MRIARVRHLFYPDMPRDYFYELSARQVKAGHSVDVLTWNRDGGSSEEMVCDDFAIHRLHGVNLGLGGVVEEYPYLPSLPAEIERLRPDVVHAESHLFLTSFQAVRRAKRLGVPCVVSVHGVFAERGSALDFAQRVYLSTLGLQVFRDATRVVCLTRGDAEYVVRLGCDPRKIRLVPNAVDTDLFRPCKKRYSNLVVWVGRFVPEKGLGYLIEAARIVAREFPDVRFLLIGYGPLKTRIMKSVLDDVLLDRHVRFLGPLRRDEIAGILGKASVFVFPSLREGSPLSVLEAMASGLPVVGSDISGVKDVVADGEDGVLVPARNPSLLAGSILRILNDSRLRAKLGRNARLSALEKHSWDGTLKKVEKVYDEALA